MNRRGFTLAEMLGCIALLGIVLCIGLFTSKGSLTTSLSRLRNVSDNEVYDSAKSYVIEKNISFNETDYVCVTVLELIEYGYLSQMNDKDIQGRVIKIVRDNKTKAINNIGYVDVCE